MLTLEFLLWFHTLTTISSEDFAKKSESSAEDGKKIINKLDIVKLNRTVQTFCEKFGPELTVLLEGGLQ